MGREFTFNGSYEFRKGGSADTVDTIIVDRYTGIGEYSQETLQNKNIYKHKSQMIYSRNYTGTPTHLLVQFLQIP